MPPILTEEGINRKFRIPYATASVILLVSVILMAYGYSNIPTKIPQSNNIQYQVYTSAEQKNIDLINYQYSSDPFKIGMCGLGSFIVSFIMFVIFSWQNRAQLEQFYELEAQRKRQEQSQQQEQSLVTAPKQDAVTIHNLTVQKPQAPIQNTLAPPLQVRRQQGPYIPYRGHLPPEYRNYGSGARVYPQV